MSKVYLVHGNTWFEGYGHEENIFGIFTDKDSAELAKVSAVKMLYKKEKNNDFSCVEDDSDLQ